MEQVTDVVGNPTALLIERIFWLGLGFFLFLAIITSLLRGLSDKRNKIKPGSSKELENLAKKATGRNRNDN